MVVRVEIPLDTLRSKGASFVLPTVFAQLGWKPGGFLSTNWRARPRHEHAPDEPWGYARDMSDDGPGLPEVIVDSREAGEMDAECLGDVRTDWSCCPYLKRSAPR